MVLIIKNYPRVDITVDVLNYLCDWSALPELMICLTVVLIKQNEDVLEGVNKLDYLLKVSCF